MKKSCRPEAPIMFRTPNQRAELTQINAAGLEDKIGTMLPCNVVVQEIGNNRTEIAAIDPVASMAAVDNPRLKEAAQRVQVLLRKAIEAL